MKKFMKTVFLACCLNIFSMFGWAQINNTVTEIIDYREVDGKIIVAASINGVEGNFVLDLVGHNALFSDGVQSSRLIQLSLKGSGLMINTCIAMYRYLE